MKSNCGVRSEHEADKSGAQEKELCYKRKVTAREQKEEGLDWKCGRQIERKKQRQEERRGCGERGREGADGASLFEAKGGSIAKSAVFNQLVMIC